MAEEGFEVRGPHEDVLEEGGHGDKFSGRIAVMTAILATLGAMFGYEGGATQNEAALLKNDASITKTEAADQWNFFQAKSSKQNLAELAISLPGTDQEKYKADIERYKKEKEDIKKAADKLEANVVELNHRSDEEMHLHHQWARATTAEQIAISLAAITMLTRKKWLQYAAYGVAAVGIALGLLAWIPH
jgi:ribosomal protein L9